MSANAASSCHSPSSQRSLIEARPTMPEMPSTTATIAMASSSRRAESLPLRSAPRAVRPWRQVGRIVGRRSDV